LGTKWEQDWQYQPNAATTSEEQASVLTDLKSRTLGITETFFQYHVYGRSPGLKIRLFCHELDSAASSERKSSYSVNGARPHPRKSGQGSRPNRPANTVGAPRLRMAEDAAQTGADLIRLVPSGSDGSCHASSSWPPLFETRGPSLSCACPDAVSVRRVTHGRGI
jgi:hypothetical protein